MLDVRCFLFGNPPSNDLANFLALVMLELSRMKLKTIQIGRLYIKAVTLILLTVWSISAGAIWHVGGLGKEFAHFSLFWSLDFLFCPFLIGVFIALLAYDSSRNTKSPSGLPRLAVFVGWALLAAFVFMVLSIVIVNR
jgi:hypothetical protein